MRSAPAAVTIAVILVTVPRILAENAGLLASTLFTFQDHACETEKLHIRCPHGTTIYIQWAQFGRSVPSNQMCPFRKALPLRRNSTIPVIPGREDTNCLATTSLQIVLDKCQDKRQCHIRANSAVFGQDPCPGTSKYLEVAYKCRPAEFHSRVTCEGQKMHLRCPKAKRIVVYSAMFGKASAGILECPETQKTTTECQARCTLENVMKMCHSKRRCDIPASTKTFPGDNCAPGVPKYLSIVYTCVPRRILRDRVEREHNLITHFCGSRGHRNGNRNKGRPTNSSRRSSTTVSPSKSSGKPDNQSQGPDPGGSQPGQGGQPGRVPKPSTFDYNLLTPGVTPSQPESNKTGSSNGTAPAKPGCQTVKPEAVKPDDEYVGFVSDWMSTVQYIEKNKEKVILYLVLGLLVGFIGVLLVIIFRLVQTRLQDRHKAQLDITDTVPQNTTGPGENTTLLESPNHDGIEILRINHSRSLSRSLQRGERTDPGMRSLNNYYG